MRKSLIAAAVLILSSFILGAYLYPHMPEQLASHWNAFGEADGYSLKFWGLFLMPIISVVLFFILALIPLIDPLKKNINEFKKSYDFFVLITVIFMLYLYLLSIFWNLGYRFSMVKLLVPAFSILFYFLGALTLKTKRNWFIGIRTPWTLSSDKVWDKTHKLGGRLLKLTAIVTLIGLYAVKYAIFFIIAPIILVSIYLVIYSYFVYKKEMKES